MAGSYTLPQVKVFQEFAQAPNDVTQNLNPCVIGPNYQLIRYSDTSERKDCTHATYTGSSKLLTWAKGYTESKVDTEWFGVTFADTYLKLGDALNGKCLDATTAGSAGTKFEFTLPTGKTLVGDKTKAQFGTSVRAGDYLQYASGTTTKKAKIKSISCGTLKDSEVEVSCKKPNSTDDFAGLSIKTDEYTGEKDVTVNATITMTGTGSAATYKIKWSSTMAGISGEDTDITKEAYVALGRGLKVKLDTTPPSDGGKCVIKLAIKEAYTLDTVTLEDNVVIPSGGTVAFTFLRYIGAEDIDTSYLENSDTGVTVAANVKIYDDGFEFAVESAEAYLSQRNFRSDHTSGVYSITTDGELITELGAITPDNPLAYGVYIARLNCATATVRFIGIASDDLEGWKKALDRASVTTEVYALCPLTENSEIIDNVVEHCKEMSKEENKSWRITFFSMPTAKTIDVTPKDGSTPEKCTVAESTGYSTLTCRPSGGTTSEESKIAKFLDTVKVDDVVTVVNTKRVKTTAKVTEVRSNTTLILDEEISDATTALCSFTITHTRDHDEYVNAIAATSTRFYNRRAYNVWPNTLKASNGLDVSGMYGAAAVCGLACSVLPQQPITNVELSGFTDVPDTYSTFNRVELNTIAAGGTLIIMQEKIGGKVYVRHQISTMYSGGNLNETELSLTKNLDSISFYFANRFAPYIGRYNVSEDLLTEIKAILQDGLAHLETATETSRLIGPQVLADGTEIRALYTSDEKDKVYCNVSLNLPAPFNNFDLHLQVI